MTHEYLLILAESMSSESDDMIRVRMGSPANGGGTRAHSTKTGSNRLPRCTKHASMFGEDKGKRSPSDWAREAGKALIHKVAKKLNTRKSGIYKTARLDRGGGTRAH